MDLQIFQEIQLFPILTTCKLSVIFCVGPNEFPGSFRCFTNLNLSFDIRKIEGFLYISFGITVCLSNSFPPAVCTIDLLKTAPVKFTDLADALYANIFVIILAVLYAISTLVP